MNNADLHPIQSKILCELLFVEESGFSQLNSNEFSSDQFSFHLRQLSDWKLIEKTESGKYKLTTKGKEYANRFDTEAKEVERQPKIGVLIVAIDRRGKETKFLAQQRLKQPFFGYWGFVTGKVRWGETTVETAERELEEETGLKGQMILIGLKHKMDYSNENVLLEDKYFLTFKVEVYEGNLIENFEGGKNKWMTEKEMLEMPEVFDDIEDIIKMVKESQFSFKEKQYKVKRY